MGLLLLLESFLQTLGIGRVGLIDLLLELFHLLLRLFSLLGLQAGGGGGFTGTAGAEAEQKGEGTEVGQAHGSNLARILAP